MQIHVGVQRAGQGSPPFDTALDYCLAGSFRINRRNGISGPTGPVIASDFPTLLGAAMQGLGLAQVPGPVAAASVKAGRLARVLETFAPMLPGLFLYYPGGRQTMPKLRAFIDHVKRRSDAAQKA